MDDSIVPVSLKLPAGLLARIDAAAVAEDRSRTATVRRVLAQAFSDDADLRAMAARRFESLTNPAGGALLPDRRPGAGGGVVPSLAADPAPVAAPARSSAGGARAGAETIPHMKDPAMPTDYETRRAAALEQAERDTAILRQRAINDPVQRPAGGAVDVAASAPGQAAAQAERKRLADWHSAPAPKGDR